MGYASGRVMSAYKPSAREMRLAAELERVTKERDAALAELGSMTMERDAAIQQRDSALDACAQVERPLSDDARAWRDYVRALDCALASAWLSDPDMAQSVDTVCDIADAIAIARKRREGWK